VHILYFHQHFSTPNGSTGTRSYEFARRLVQEGHKVTLVCGSYWLADSGLRGKYQGGRRRGIVDGIEVIEFDLQYSNSDSFLTRTITFIKYAVNGIKLALSLKYNLLFASSTPLTASIPGIFARVFRNKPFIFEVRDLWPELPKAMGVIENPFILKLMDLLETASYKTASACIGLSPGIVDGIKSKSPQKRVAMIPNGCDLHLTKQKNNFKKNGSINAIFTGAHGIANGLDAILDAAKILKQKERSDINFQFIGDGMLKPKLKERVKKEELSNCEFLDPIPKKELFQYIQRHADVGLMILANVPAFYYGTSPNKFFDYIAAGLPVVTNYPGWVAEMITENENGIAVSPENSTAFADAMEILADDCSKLKSFGKNSYKLAELKFGRKLLSKKFTKFVFEVYETSN